MVLLGFHLLSPLDDRNEKNYYDIIDIVLVSDQVKFDGLQPTGRYT